jgi:protein CpxP
MKARTLVLTIAGVALALGSTLALAGPGRWGHEGREGRGMHGPLGPMGMALDRLDLSQEQQDKIKAVFEAERPALHALRQQLRQGRQAFREAHPMTATVDEAAIRAQVAAQSKIWADIAVEAALVRAKVLAVLTADQLTELKQMRDCFDQHGPGPMGGPDL